MIPENKYIPKFSPEQLTIELDEGTSGIVNTNEIIEVTDSDAVSTIALMCKIIMMKLDQLDLTLRRPISHIYIYIYIYMEHPFLMFLDHTQRRSTVGRTPLDE